MAVRHFLTLNDMSTAELEDLLVHASKLRQSWQNGEIRDSLKNRVLAMIFEKSSTRTRVSFEAGMFQLGGSALFLSPGIPSSVAVSPLRIPPSSFPAWSTP